MGDRYSSRPSRLEAEARQLERSQLLSSIRAMELAQQNPLDCRLRSAAITEVYRVWMNFMESLARDDNVLSTEVRASLLSIGCHVLRGCDEQRFAEKSKFHFLIELSEIILEGLN